MPSDFILSTLGRLRFAKASGRSESRSRGYSWKLVTADIFVHAHDHRGEAALLNQLASQDSRGGIRLDVRVGLNVLADLVDLTDALRQKVFLRQYQLLITVLCGCAWATLYHKIWNILLKDTRWWC